VISIGERKKLREIIPLQRRCFRIVYEARKTKPQRSHAPPSKPNSIIEHQRQVNPKSKWTQLRIWCRWIPLPLPMVRRSETRENGAGGRRRQRRAYYNLARPHVLYGRVLYQKFHSKPVRNLIISNSPHSIEENIVKRKIYQIHQKKYFWPLKKKLCASMVRVDFVVKVKIQTLSSLIHTRTTILQLSMSTRLHRTFHLRHAGVVVLYHWQVFFFCV
jgi:hypothetical protein